MNNAGDSEKDIERCLLILRSGGIILYPTDTVWGIGCDATDGTAVEKIISLKNRPDSKSFVVLVADERDILQYVAAPDLALFNYLQQTAKPTTVIYQNVLEVADNVKAKDGSVAIRICKDAFCRHLIKRFRKPIVSTSANFSGDDSPANFSLIHPNIIAGVDYAVQYRRNDNRTAQPSAIIEWKNGVVNVIRP